MSFLRKVRNSISRGNSSTRDSTPNSRRSPSIECKSKRRDSIESKPEGLQRSETFTIENANESILAKVKPTKKQKSSKKFGTYTRTSNAPHPPPTDVKEVKDKPYYSWKSGIVADPVEAAQDPFNFLYEQPSSLQSDLSGYSENITRKPTQPIDSSTFKKNRISRQLREQLEQLKNPPEISEEIENDPDKFRTITINSFRRSFREKFLAKQNEVPHNPSWFVGVDQPSGGAKPEKAKDSDNRSGIYVYENDSYRPTSRSPVRNRTPLQSMTWTSIRNMSPVRDFSPTRSFASAREISPVRPERPERPERPARSHTRGSVKRTETFRVERPPIEPSIRIEIKNSITPNQPGRMVPVGVAKPMPSQTVNQQTIRNNRFESSDRNTWNHQPSQRTHEKQGRYQTCVQITSNDAFPISKESTRVRFSGNTRSPLRYIVSKRNDPPAKLQTYFDDSIPQEIQTSAKTKHYNQQLDFTSYSHRPSRQQTSGMMNRNEQNRYSMTQSVPRRSRSPIKVPWR